MDGVLQAEEGNEGVVHLYHVNDCWSAVEKSAYFLSQLIDCDIITLLAKGRRGLPDRQILLASVSETHLSAARNEYSILRNAGDHLVLKPRHILSSHYAEWHQANILTDIDEDDFEYPYFLTMTRSMRRGTEVMIS